MDTGEETLSAGPAVEHRLHLTRSVIFFVQASCASGANWRYVREQSGKVVLQADGSVQDEGRHYPHLLAYIEATEKIPGEWQRRHLPDRASIFSP